MALRMQILHQKKKHENDDPGPRHVYRIQHFQGPLKDTLQEKQEEQDVKKGIAKSMDWQSADGIALVHVNIHT